MAEEEKHRNDIYGTPGEASANNPAIPAATVVLVRDTPDDLEVLMLKKNANISFGGMWVFPGGRIDDDDYEGEDLLRAARNAAVRETEEETSLSLDGESFVWFSHWTPPPETPRRYATWFFVAEVDHGHEIEVDGGEILHHQWIVPETALQLHAENKIDLAPPTWITLHQLTLHKPAGRLLDTLRRREEKTYKTRILQDSAGNRIAMWRGDAGYDSGDADTDGHRHRLILGKSGFVFENTIETY